MSKAYDKISAGLNEVLNSITEANAADKDAIMFLSELYKGDNIEASLNEILKAIQTIFEWISKESFSTIDAVMSFADPKKLAPEVQIAILRTTCNVQGRLNNWVSFFDKVQQKFLDKGLNDDIILQGL